MRSFLRELNDAESTASHSFVTFAATGDVAALRSALAKALPNLDVAGGETAVRFPVGLMDHDDPGGGADAGGVAAREPPGNRLQLLLSSHDFRPTS